MLVIGDVALTRSRELARNANFYDLPGHDQSYQRRTATSPPGAFTNEGRGQIRAWSGEITLLLSTTVVLACTERYRAGYAKHFIVDDYYRKHYLILLQIIDSADARLSISAA